MRAELRGSYRERIYAVYFSQCDAPLAPQTVEGFAPRLPYLRRLIHRHFPRDKTARILELGCGHGALIYALSRAGYQDVRGVDGSPEQVEAAQRLGIHGVEQGDLMATLKAAPSASFDVVVAFDVIEHFTKGELIPLVDEVHRVLKPGARWIIHTPNAESPFFASVRYGDFTHELAFTRLSLAQLLCSSGFERLECFEDRPVPHGLKSATRSLLWRVIRIGLLGYLAIETGAFNRRAVFSQNLLAVGYKNKGWIADVAMGGTLPDEQPLFFKGTN